MAGKAKAVKKMKRLKEHAGKGGKREAKGHEAIGSHTGYSIGMKKR